MPVLSWQTHTVSRMELIGDNQPMLQKEDRCDISYSLPGTARFRVNIFVQRGSHAIVMRVIPKSIPSFDEIQLADRRHQNGIAHDKETIERRWEAETLVMASTTSHHGRFEDRGTDHRSIPLAEQQTDRNLRYRFAAASPGKKRERTRGRHRNPQIDTSYPRVSGQR